MFYIFLSRNLFLYNFCKCFGVRFPEVDGNKETVLFKKQLIIKGGYFKFLVFRPCWKLR
jgi:hypothetical protein